MVGHALSSSSITPQVPTEAWNNTQALMKLEMSGNPIKLIRRGAFGDLKFVTNLGLSHCAIETVETGAFNGMDRSAH